MHGAPYKRGVLPSQNSSFDPKILPAERNKMSSSSFDSSDSEQQNNHHRKTSRFHVSPAELNNNNKTAVMEERARKVPKRVASIRSDPQKMRVKYKRSMSATADMPVLSEYNLRQVLTKERVPHMDHYRQSVDFGKNNLVKS